MTVASLELCNELYELSGWDDTVYQYTADRKDHFHKDDSAECRNCEVEFGAGSRPSVPAYDLGYLLRKLPNVTLIFNPELYFNKWFIRYGDQTNEVQLAADTPEDAACKLAIELFKQGILK